MFCFGVFFFVYKKSGLFSVALLMPTRGHHFTQSAAAQRLLTCEKSGSLCAPGFLPDGSLTLAEKQTVPV